MSLGCGFDLPSGGPITEAKIKFPVPSAKEPPTQGQVDSVSVSKLIYPLILLGSGLYGFFGPNRLNGCDGLADPNDWLHANLVCPGFSAMQYIVGRGLPLVVALAVVVKIIERLRSAD